MERIQLEALRVAGLTKVIQIISKIEYDGIKENIPS